MPFIKTLTLMTNFGTAAINRLYLFASNTQNEPGAAEIGEAARDTAKSIFQTFNSYWQELGDGRSSIFIATVRVSLVIATILIALWAIPWINTMLEEGYSQKTVDQLIYPLLVVFMLGINNGILLSNACLLGRTTINYLDNRVLQVTINNIKIEQAIRQSNITQALEQMLGGELDQCKLLPTSDTNQQGIDSQSACINAAIEKIKRIAQDNNQKNQAQGWSFNLNLNDFDIGKMITGAVNSQIQREMYVLFSAFQGAFVFLIEITVLLNAYIAPIFLSLSLIPGQAKIIHAWLAGFLGLGLLKVSYTLIIGIATSSVVSNNNDTNPLLLPLVQAVLSPILAVIIASGGGVALFSGLTSVGGGSLRFLMRANSTGRRS